ncbi:unnamed protein product [Didymodactylos carnosus]|uniref:Medium-chain acyl-CoA ligase ACSF2, mitochondrial n=1 Tax=Didymodactylos carnosus TaxID=1234261 RepID=A0A815E2F7_9BILA|nr:unnamed protein product [Didymodactylos carnosus]CAF1309271.1 unnamed protein product [Didymodactylos carnosus]CAF3951912.1 unnamed protein product [Didymodactylos carnosus]CAF4145337.1 unnamed protein product [Didymodactylos carnosus]
MCQIRKNDLVGVWLTNRFEWVILQYATARLGALLVSINPLWKLTELEDALNVTPVKLIITMKRNEVTKTNHEQLLSNETRKIQKSQVLYLEDGWTYLRDSAANVTDTELSEIENSLQFDDAINIKFTSGTVGRVKAALLSHHNILNNAYFTAVRLGYTEQDRTCVPVSFSHCFGTVCGIHSSLSMGGCLVIPSETFEIEKVLTAIEHEKCTSLLGVPTMFMSILNSLKNRENYDLSSLRTGQIGGAFCPRETMELVLTQMNIKQMTIGYGMTENSGCIAQTFVDDSLERYLSTVGKALDHTEIKIVNQNTNEVVKRGEIGELCTRGYHVMLGYYENETATKQILEPNSKWLRTGDLAVMDEHDYIQVVGRIKDLIIRGGQNIYPKEIEEYLTEHPAVNEVHVIGIPSEKYGEELMAWVKLNSDSRTEPVGEIDLIEFCLDQISSYKIPTHWKFVEEFPRTATGKVRKAEMRQISIKELINRK